MDLQLKALRKKAKLSQELLASMANINLSTYRKWERNINAITLEGACAIADILDCTLDELAGRTPPDNHEYADKRQANVNYAFVKLSDQGKEEAAKQMDLLTYKYKKCDPSASEQVA